MDRQPTSSDGPLNHHPDAQRIAKNRSSAGLIAELPKLRERHAQAKLACKNCLMAMREATAHAPDVDKIWGASVPQKCPSVMELFRPIIAILEREESCAFDAIVKQKWAIACATQRETGSPHWYGERYTPNDEGGLNVDCGMINLETGKLTTL